MVFRLTYRARQFCNALFSPRERISSQVLVPFLPPALFNLFRQMRSPEQFHAFQVFEQLKSSGQDNPDLLTAALLHDVGKITYPLSLFDRVIVVMGNHLFPHTARRWGEGNPTKLHRAFVVAAHHAEWGADLAKRAGASKQTVELIRRHQEPLALKPRSPTEHLLAKLQAGDNEN
jgi:hypothetical protein